MNAFGQRLKNAALLKLIEKQEAEGKGGLIDMSNPTEILDPSETLAKRNRQLSLILQRKAFDDKKKYKDTLGEGKKFGIIPELNKAPAETQEEPESNCCKSVAEFFCGIQEIEDEEEPELPSNLKHLRNKH